METKSEKQVRKTFTIFGWVITGVLLLLVLLLLIFGLSSMKKGKMMKIFGYSYSVIASESMKPTINVNDIILIKCNYDFDDIEVDDIIVFYNPQEKKNISHRVVARLEDNSLQTCGDHNNGLVDSFHVTEEYYIGKVVKYGRCLGIGALITNGRAVFFIALAAIFLYIIVSEFINIYKITMKKKHEERMKEIEETKKKQEEELRAEILKELQEEMKKES